jgi:hypothetical protein
MPLQDESTKDKHNNALTAPTTLIEGGDEAIGVAHLLHHIGMFKRIHRWSLVYQTKMSMFKISIECFVGRVY